ncbi:MAG TPA: hypothetical protein GX506_12230 [Firmicutes bacterium]|nr:hypothetical protein [Bacillota bacterium]
MKHQGLLRMRRPSLFMVTYIKTPGLRMGIPFVVPRFVVFETVGAAFSLLRLVMWASPRLRSRFRAVRADLHGLTVQGIIDAAHDILRELWSQGSWTFVDIKAEDGTRILIRFI